MAKSTTENPAERGGGDEVAVETVSTATVEAAGIERASIVAATHVQYIGTAHVAEITGAQWKAAGVEGQGKTVWDKRVFRGDRVAVADLSPGAIEYLDQFDDRFRFVDASGKRV